MFIYFKFFKSNYKYKYCINTKHFPKFKVVTSLFNQEIYVKE